MDEILLSIIIVNFNGKHFLADCLDSIEKQISCSHEVILVDNASSDGSAEFIREKYPFVILVESRVNTGFTGGNNLGARLARGRFFLLLNNDTKLLSDIAPLLNEFEDDTLGALGCRIYYGDGRQQFSFGFEHTPSRIILSWLGLGGILLLPNWFRRNEMNVGSYDEPHKDIDWVSGAAMLTARSLWEQMKGLDEGYFMYIEDVDYCKRVRNAGYRVAYSPDAEVIHYEGAGKPWLGSNALNYSMQSYIRYIGTFYGSCNVFLLRGCLASIMFCRAMVYGIISLFSGSELLKDKERAYFLASATLLKSRIERTQ